jgi:hypothetical protein
MLVMDHYILSDSVMMIRAEYRRLQTFVTKTICEPQLEIKYPTGGLSRLLSWQ